MITVTVDASAIKNAAKALREVGLVTTDKLIVRALNRTGDKVRTDMKRILAEVTGERVGKIMASLHRSLAAPGNLTYTITARDKWERITAGSFGARETRAGVRHRAWGRSQLARGAFLLAGVAVARKGRSRLPLRNLYGPNIAREIERDQGQKITGAVYNAVAQTFAPRLLHEVDRELKRVKGKYGL